jgi:hypothetical protein
VFVLTSLDATTGVKVYGYDALSFTGHAVSGAGDYNGDGYDDVIIGQLGPIHGNTFVVFGGPSVGDVFELSSVVSKGLTGGVRLFDNYSNTYAGGSVSGAGDVNGDGYDDVIVGM